MGIGVSVLILFFFFFRIVTIQKNIQAFYFALNKHFSNKPDYFEKVNFQVEEDWTICLNKGNFKQELLH